MCESDPIIYRIVRIPRRRAAPASAALVGPEPLQERAVGPDQAQALELARQRLGLLASCARMRAALRAMPRGEYDRARGAELRAAAADLDARLDALQALLDTGGEPS